jgi:hypothetical protein
MTDIQLLKVTELLNQHGDLIVETGRDNSDFMLWFESDRFILIDKFGNEAWHLNGELHRTDGPAYIGQPDSKGNSRVLSGGIKMANCIHHTDHQVKMLTQTKNGL